MSDKPPVGIRPQWLVLEERQAEICDAMKRYDERALLPPDEWLLELKEIENQLAELLPERAPQQPEPVDAEFTPPVVEIPEPIRTGAAPFYVVVVSDDNPRGPGGEPIVWEHPLQSTTLQAVLRKQADIGSRYGTTHIAECRIIPELTREVPREVHADA